MNSKKLAFALLAVVAVLGAFNAKEPQNAKKAGEVSSTVAPTGSGQS